MKKATVGIIANPESGKDIRRLIAHASVFENMEKVNIVKRILLVLQDFGIEKVIGMPDTFGIIPEAIRTISETLRLEVEMTPITVFGDWRDTYNATRAMKNRVSTIIVIGGDGTNRIVAKTSGDIPILPISTGTNNVFPYMIEATIAGEAVAVMALGVVKPDEGAYKTKRIEIFEDGSLKDLALVDAVATKHIFVGSRALWKIEYIKEIIVTMCSPYNIGLSSIPGMLKEIREEDDLGFYVELGKGKVIKAPIAPGIFKLVSVKDFKLLTLEEEIEIKTSPSLFAFDGEREKELKGKTIARITRNGPRIIDYKKTLRLAVKRGFFEKSL